MVYEIDTFGNVDKPINGLTFCSSVISQFQHFAENLIALQFGTVTYESSRMHTILVISSKFGDTVYNGTLYLFDP